MQKIKAVVFHIVVPTQNWMPSNWNCWVRLKYICFKYIWAICANPFIQIQKLSVPCDVPCTLCHGPDDYVNRSMWPRSGEILPHSGPLGWVDEEKEGNVSLFLLPRLGFVLCSVKCKQSNLCQQLPFLQISKMYLFVLQNVFVTITECISGFCALFCEM